MPQEVAISIALGVLNGLGHAHGLTDGAGQPLSIVHRDLSPDNVMVSYAGQVKIIDFGTARARLGDFRTTPGVRIGTLFYMSPEQSMSMQVDLRSDLYTVAVLLWEMLTGQQLVKSSTSIDVMEEIAYREAPRANDIDPSISDELADVAARGLAKEPTHRWQSAKELAEALRDVCPSRELATADIGRFVREMFPDAEAAAAKAIELGRMRHFQDHEQTLPEYSAPTAAAEATVYIDTLAPEVKTVRLPPDLAKIELPAPKPSPLGIWVLLFVAMMVGFTLGLITERAGWWRPPSPGGPSLQRGNP